jgi:hypothetical protein
MVRDEICSQSASAVYQRSASGLPVAYQWPVSGLSISMSQVSGQSRLLYLIVSFTVTATPAWTDAGLMPGFRVLGFQGSTQLTLARDSSEL